MAQVKTSFDYMLIGPIGSREACTTFYREKMAACVFPAAVSGGRWNDFAAAVEKTHAEESAWQGIPRGYRFSAGNDGTRKRLTRANASQRPPRAWVNQLFI
jgi:hypothetical protein